MLLLKCKTYFDACETYISLYQLGNLHLYDMVGASVDVYALVRVIGGLGKNVQEKDQLLVFLTALLAGG